MRDSRASRRDSRFATLIEAMQAELRGDALAVRALPESDAQWRALLAVADWHRVSAVLARTTPADAAPGWVRERLDEALMHDTARSLRLDHARAGVLAALAEAGIQAMPLKGSALVETVYPDATWRDMSDIDLLVERDRHAEARRGRRGPGLRALYRARNRNLARITTQS